MDRLYKAINTPSNGSSPIHLTRRHIMKIRTITILLVLVSAIALLGVAQEAETTNFMVIDGEAWLIEVFSSVKVFAIDPETDERIDIEPTVSMLYPKDPIKMELEPGLYEFVVGMSHLPKDVFYFAFEIVEDGELLVIDLRKIDLPEELAVY
jgi:hypothetical protein